VGASNTGFVVSLSGAEYEHFHGFAARQWSFTPPSISWANQNAHDSIWRAGSAGVVRKTMGRSYRTSNACAGRQNTAWGVILDRY